LTLGKIIKIVAIRCQILRLKCTKFNFGWGSTPDPAGEHCPLGELTAPPEPLAGLRGLLLRGGGGTGRGGRGKGREGREGEGELRGGEGTKPHPITPP